MREHGLLEIAVDHVGKNVGLAGGIVTRTQLDRMT
jgi:hypothetical protein